MGHLAPILFAFLLNFTGVEIFTDSKKSKNLPFVSYVIFLVAILYLLWDINLRPLTFRKLYYWAEFLIEFAVALLLMEWTMTNFWLPLELALLALLPKIGNFTTFSVEKMGFSSTDVTKYLDFLNWKGTFCIVSYFLSIFSLICTLHATRVIDLRLLRCDPEEFFADASQRIKEFYEKLNRSLYHSFYSKKKICFASGTKPYCKYDYPNPDDLVYLNNMYQSEQEDSSDHERSSDYSDYCRCSSTSFHL